MNIFDDVYKGIEAGVDTASDIVDNAGDAINDTMKAGSQLAGNITQPIMDGLKNAFNANTQMNKQLDTNYQALAAKRENERQAELKAKAKRQAKQNTLQNMFENSIDNTINMADNLLIAGRASLGGAAQSLQDTGILAADAVEGLANIPKAKADKTNLIDSDAEIKATKQTIDALATFGNLTNEKRNYATAGRWAGMLGVDLFTMLNPVGAALAPVIGEAKLAKYVKLVKGAETLMESSLGKAAVKESVRHIDPSIVNTVIDNPAVENLMKQSPKNIDYLANFFNASKNYFGETAFEYVKGSSLLDKAGGITKDVLGAGVAALTGAGAGRYVRKLQKHDLMNIMLASAATQGIKLLQKPLAPVADTVVNTISKFGKPAAKDTSRIEGVLGASTDSMADYLKVENPGMPAVLNASDNVSDVLTAPLRSKVFRPGQTKNQTFNNIMRWTMGLFNPKTLDELVSANEEGYRVLSQMKAENGLVTLGDLKHTPVTIKIDLPNGSTRDYGYTDFLKEHILRKYNKANKTDLKNITDIDEHTLPYYMSGYAGKATDAEISAGKISQAVDDVTLRPSAYAEHVITHYEKQAGVKVTGAYRDAMKDAITESVENNITNTYNAINPSKQAAYASIGVQKANIRLNNFSESLTEALLRKNPQETTHVLETLNDGVDDYIRAMDNYQNYYVNTTVTRTLGNSPAYLKTTAEQLLIRDAHIADANRAVQTVEQAIHNEIDYLRQSGQNIPEHILAAKARVSEMKAKISTMGSTMDDALRGEVEGYKAQQRMYGANPTQDFLQQGVNLMDRVRSSTGAYAKQSIVSRISQLALGHNLELSKYSDPSMVARNFNTAVSKTDQQFTNSIHAYKAAKGADAIQNFGNIAKTGKTMNTVQDVERLLMDSYGNPVQALLNDKSLHMSKSNIMNAVDKELAAGFLKSAIFRNEFINKMVMPEATKILMKSGLTLETAAGRNALYNISSSIIRNTGLSEQEAWKVMLEGKNGGKIVNVGDPFGWQIAADKLVGNQKYAAQEFSKTIKFMTSYLGMQYKSSINALQGITEIVDKARKGGGMKALTPEDRHHLYSSLSTIIARGVIWGPSHAIGDPASQLGIDLNQQDEMGNQGYRDQNLWDRTIDGIARYTLKTNKPTLDRLAELSKNPSANKTEIDQLEKVLDRQTKAQTSDLKWGLYGKTTGFTHGRQTVMGVQGAMSGLEIFNNVVTKLVYENLTRLHGDTINNLMTGLITKGQDKTIQGKLSDKIESGEFQGKADTTNATAYSSQYAYSKDPMTDVVQYNDTKQLDDLEAQLSQRSASDIAGMIVSLDDKNPDSLMKRYVDMVGGEENAVNRLSELLNKNPKVDIKNVDKDIQSTVRKFDPAIWTDYKNDRINKDSVIKMIDNSGMLDMGDESLFRVYMYAYHNNPQLLDMMDSLGLNTMKNLDRDTVLDIYDEAERLYTKQGRNETISDTQPKETQPESSTNWADNVYGGNNTAPMNMVQSNPRIEGINEKLRYYMQKGFSYEEAYQMVSGETAD